MHSEVRFLALALCSKTMAVSRQGTYGQREELLKHDCSERSSCTMKSAYLPSPCRTKVLIVLLSRDEM